jgi:hypothetical protein
VAKAVELVTLFLRRYAPSFYPASGGYVTAVRPGTATIQASWSANNWDYDDTGACDPVTGACGGYQGGGGGQGQCTYDPIATQATADFTGQTQVSVNGVGFTGNFQITRWSNGTVIDNPDGSTPTWTSTSNPNDPVAYAKGANPTVFATFSISPSASQGSMLSIGRDLYIPDFGVFGGFVSSRIG